MTNRLTRLANLPKGALPLALLLALPLTAAQARPTAKPGPQAIRPKPDDPRQVKPAGKTGAQAIGPKPDDPRQVKPAGKTGAQAIGPKPDDPRQVKPAQAVPKADPRKEGLKR